MKELSFFTLIYLFFLLKTQLSKGENLVIMSWFVGHIIAADMLVVCVSNLKEEEEEDEEVEEEEDEEEEED